MAQPIKKFLLYVRSLIVQWPRVSDMDSGSREHWYSGGKFPPCSTTGSESSREEREGENWQLERSCRKKRTLIPPPPPPNDHSVWRGWGGGVLVPTHGEIVDRVLTVVLMVGVCGLQVANCLLSRVYEHVLLICILKG